MIASAAAAAKGAINKAVENGGEKAEKSCVGVKVRGAGAQLACGLISSTRLNLPS